MQSQTNLGDFRPLRAARVGYMAQCIFFGDENGDGRVSISLGERSQPSGPHGEVALYLPGESDTLFSPVKQQAPEGPCADTLTGKKQMALLFAMQKGAIMKAKQSNYCRYDALWRESMCSQKSGLYLAYVK
jgi:hypothetical protein